MESNCRLVIRMRSGVLERKYICGMGLCCKHIPRPPANCPNRVGDRCDNPAAHAEIVEALNDRMRQTISAAAKTVLCDFSLN